MSCLSTCDFRFELCIGSCEPTDQTCRRECAVSLDECKAYCPPLQCDINDLDESGRAHVGRSYGWSKYPAKVSFFSNKP